MKKIIALLLSVSFVFCMLSSCGNTSQTEPSTSQSPDNVQTPASGDASPLGTNSTPEPPDNNPVEIYVFAAASMTETLTDIIENYKAVAPNVTIIVTYDSSGTLKTQIEEGANCDLFISAAQKQMNQLEINSDGNDAGLDFVDSATRVNLLENKVVLVVPDDNPKEIESFEDLATDKLSLLCIGNEDVPVGAYSEEILMYLGVLDSLKKESKLTYSSNVKEVTTQVSEATVDAGIIYATDAFSAKLTVVDEAASDMCRQVIYPAAVMKNSTHPEEAKAFLNYLQTEAAMQVFQSVGFSPAK